MSVSTVNGYVGRARVAKLSWPLPTELDDDAALTRLLFPDEHQPRADRPEPDWAQVHLELKKKHGRRWTLGRCRRLDGRLTLHLRRRALDAAAVEVDEDAGEVRDVVEDVHLSPSK